MLRMRLQPGRRNSGRSEPQLPISKEGDPYLRTLLVQGAQHILGPFGIDCDLRRWGLRLAERGGKSGKKRAIRCDRKKARGAAASPVGERRSVRTVVQQQPNESGGSRVEQKNKTKVKTVPGREKTKAKTEFR
jgi:Transposase IS116/IS110/IS902 family